MTETTPYMDASAVAQDFNASADRRNWRAVQGGTRTLPTVIFKSATSMIELTYYTQTGVFGVVFTKANCAWGDFNLSIHKALLTILSALKACGHDVRAPLEPDDGVLRTQYDPRTKTTFASIAMLDDDWETYEVSPAPRFAAMETRHEASIGRMERVQEAFDAFTPDTLEDAPDAMTAEDAYFKADNEAPEVSDDGGENTD